MTGIPPATGSDESRVTSLCRARAATMGLREELAGIGIPAEVIRCIIPAGDLGDGEYVRMGTWPADAADLLRTHLAAARGQQVTPAEVPGQIL